MNKTTKIVLTIFVGLIFAKQIGKFAYDSFHPKPKPWSNEYARALHDTMSRAIKGTLTNDNQREQAVGCIIEKLKTKLPNGLESVSKDSIYQIEYRFSRDCFSQIKNIEGSAEWTKDGEDEFRKGFLRKISSNKYTLDAKDKLCSCVIERLKIKYPDGLKLPLQDSVINSIVSGCVAKIKNSH